MAERPPVIVVGAGIAGVACAAEVAKTGLPVRLLDRGTEVGGRLAARNLRDTGTRWDGHVVDVGASYLTAPEHDLRELVDGWVDRGLAHAWTDTFHVANAEGLMGTRTGPMRYGTSGGLKSLIVDLAARLPRDLVEIRRSTDAQAVTVVAEQSGLRPMVDETPAAAVALAMPDPQARRLLVPGDPWLHHARAATEGVLWEPVIVVTAVYEQRCWPDLDGVFVNGDPVLTWIADDGRRRGDGAAVLVAHVASGLSGAHLDEPEAVVGPVLDELRRILGIDRRPAATMTMRWRFARPVAAWPEDHFWDPDAKVGLAGDGWHGGPRVGSAWLSGRDLGRTIAAALS